MKKIIFLVAICYQLLANGQLHAQGTWTNVTNLSPDSGFGEMLLLNDGSVICKTNAGGIDQYGNVWDKLTPDSLGSYVNGTWSRIAPMVHTRLYCSSQILKDGRVYIAGGEYGTGFYNGEIYNPLTDSWTPIPLPPPGDTNYLYDANSEILPDGKVLDALVYSPMFAEQGTIIYNPVTNRDTIGPTTHGSHDESAWVKLKDSSILYVDFQTTNADRYIPKLGKWVVSGHPPVALYDSFGGETGPAFLLPDGRAFFLGGSGNTCYYTPSGDSLPGTWTAGPVMPDGVAAADASASMMVNGIILCALSPAPTSSIEFNSPTYFFEFDYRTNTFTEVFAPGGNTYLNEPSFFTNMLNLPDGNIMECNFYTNQYYIYTPLGAPLAAGKPTIDKVIADSCPNYTLIGKLFNGISEGSAYGDDWQMATNYPIIRLTNGTQVYYARTHNWNNTGVMTDSLEDTVQFTIPTTMPAGTYSLVVTANGNPSNPVLFTPCITGVDPIENPTSLSVFPNPATNEIIVQLQGSGKINLIELYTVTGQLVLSAKPADKQFVSINSGGIANGVYLLKVQTEDGNTLVKRVEIIR